MLRKAQDILTGIKILESKGSWQELSINDICQDSRKARDGFAFFAIKGTQSDGHHFIPSAIEQGCKLVICQDMPKIVQAEVCFIKVEDTFKAFGYACHRYFEEPSTKIELIGITGTNGKTTVATLLYQLFTQFGINCGLLSTVENRIGNEVFKATHTTPDSYQLNFLLDQMVKSGCSYAFMEVSSHALDQSRVAGVQFGGALFTNITQDHLDYHGDFNHYIYSKKKLFDGLSKNAFVLINKDDRHSNIMIQNCKAKIKTFALKTLADYKGKVLENNITGLVLDINNIHFYCKMIGEFNASNILAVFGTAIECGLNAEKTLTILSSLSGAKGRFEYYSNPTKQTTAILDYAHTPDALENVLKTIQHFKGKGRVLTVVGCGGNRDKDKRPKMGRIAKDMSDLLILTSDNPRFENPGDIIEEMFSGIISTDREKVLKIADRKEAIKVAIALSQPLDIILVAGKGHEDYQEVNGEKLPFDDSQVIREMMGI